MDIAVKRLRMKDRADARRLFCLLGEVFEEKCAPLSDRYLEQLLAREDFWALAALSGEDIIGGATAYTLPMTCQETAEIFIYDVAVISTHRRKGVGRQLIRGLRQEAAKAGIHELFVAADNLDEHALDFYKRLGRAATATTLFAFSTR
jgi:aminoglycoside 3-N-acetyltransferase I